MQDPRADDVTWKTALLRGVFLKCPRCGEGRLLKGYLTPQDVCSHCDLPLGDLKAEDGPAFFTMSIVCFFVLPGLYLLDARYEFSILVTLALALALTSLSLLTLMPIVKGAFLAAAWKSKAESDT